MLDLSSAALVDFPLRGEWRAVNTPAQRVPSHGTDYFGQRYAFDFVQTDSSGSRFCRQGLLRHALTIVPAAAFFCWDQPVHAAFGGRVIAIGDGWPDRLRVNLVWELVRGTLLAQPPGTNDYRPLAGNFVLLEGDVGVALYAHLRAGSVRVRPGQTVAAGDVIGSVGNSGNSTMPHLHFHVMDGPDPLAASGVLCAFASYERFVDGAWMPVDRGLPGLMERVRVRIG